MNASVQRIRGGEYYVEVSTPDNHQEHRLFVPTAQDAADFLAENYPGIVAEWNV